MIPRRPLPRRLVNLRLFATYQLHPSGGYQWEWLIDDRETNSRTPDLVSGHKGGLAPRTVGGRVLPVQGVSNVLVSVVASSAGRRSRMETEIIKQTPGLAPYLVRFGAAEGRLRHIAARLDGWALAEPGLTVGAGVSCWLEAYWVASPKGERLERCRFELAAMNGETVVGLSLVVAGPPPGQFAEDYARGVKQLKGRSRAFIMVRERVMPVMEEFLASLF
jgi:hypothetical protein